MQQANRIVGVALWTVIGVAGTFIIPESPSVVSAAGPPPPHGVQRMLTPPPIEERYKVAEVVVRAIPVRIQRVQVASEVEYNIITFSVAEIYKGKSRLNLMQVAEINGETKEGRYLNIIVQTQSYASERFPPKYQLGKAFALFLTPVTGFLYGRTSIEDRFPQVDWSDSVAGALAKARSETGAD